MPQLLLLELKQNATIRLYDLYGKIILTDKITGMEFNLIIDNIKPGLYFVEITDDLLNSETKKLIIR